MSGMLDEVEGVFETPILESMYNEVYLPTISLLSFIVLELSIFRLYIRSPACISASCLLSCVLRQHMLLRRAMATQHCATGFTRK
jgi:hypothetical protein